MTTGELPLRITVERPPRGVAIQVQRGRDDLLAPSRSSPEEISFDFTVRLGAPRSSGELRFLGEFAQGPPAARFVYVNSGKRAGQSGTSWDRRAKVALGGITTAQAERVLTHRRLVLEARIEGTAGDGGPMCGSVRLLGKGWTVSDAAARRG